MYATEAEVIKDLLIEQIPEIRRRECTPRVMAVADMLLDRLIELRDIEV